MQRHGTSTSPAPCTGVAFSQWPMAFTLPFPTQVMEVEIPRTSARVMIPHRHGAPRALKPNSLHFSSPFRSPALTSKRANKEKAPVDEETRAHMTPPSIPSTRRRLPALSTQLTYLATYLLTPRQQAYSLHACIQAHIPSHISTRTPISQPGPSTQSPTRRRPRDKAITRRSADLICRSAHRAPGAVRSLPQ